VISEERLRQVELALWPQGESTPGSLWAILDCARDRQIHGQLVLSRLDYQCLYAGDVPTELRLVAPHMVELSPRYAFTRNLLSQGWGKSWGVFARISDPTALRHHLRKLLTVRDEARSTRGPQAAVPLLRPARAAQLPAHLHTRRTGPGLRPGHALPGRGPGRGRYPRQLRL
jgi:Domain of unknown function (DUF4123)